MEVGEMQKSWEETFIAITEEISKRSHCKRIKVGAVIANMDLGAQTILSFGYNGPPRGIAHCDEKEYCEKRDGKRQCVGAHAEINAIINAARNGIRIEGATLFVNASPCMECAKHIVNTRFKEVVYLKLYSEFPDFEEKEPEAQQAILHIREGKVNCRQLGQ